MTEEEAKTKWCPMVRASFSDNDGNSSNRSIPESLNESDEEDYNPRYARCIGSKCAMWDSLDGMCGIIARR